MRFWFKKKTLYDHVAEGSLNDATIAKRIKTWLNKGSPRLKQRAIALYDKQSPQVKEEFARHGLTVKFVENHRRKLRENQ